MKPLMFDIPAQPLREALFAYTNTTGVGVLVDESVTKGRQSASVEGQLSPEDALNTLLTGTGLAFQYTAADAFTLVPAARATLPAVLRDDGRDEAYFRAVQIVLKSVLCSRAQTTPGQYRVIVQLWIGGTGVVVRSSLLESSGSRYRDQMLSAMLEGLSVGKAPPPGLPQPVTLVILPRTPEVTNDCAPAQARN